MKVLSANSKPPETRDEVVQLKDVRPGKGFCLHIPHDTRPEEERIKEIMMVVSPIKDGLVKVVALNEGETAGSTDLNRSYSQEMWVVPREITVSVSPAKQIPIVAE